MDKADRMALLMREMLKTYRDKNADYGDSFAKSYEEFGMTAPIIRMSDKLERLKSLSKAEARVKDESKRDTLIDLANYAMMTVVEIEEEERNKKNRPNWMTLCLGEEVKVKECEDPMTGRLETRGNYEEYTEGDKLNI